MYVEKKQSNPLARLEEPKGKCEIQISSIKLWVACPHDFSIRIKIQNVFSFYMIVAFFFFNIKLLLFVIELNSNRGTHSQPRAETQRISKFKPLQIWLVLHQRNLWSTEDDDLGVAENKNKNKYRRLHKTRKPIVQIVYGWNQIRIFENSLPVEMFDLTYMSIFQFSVC